MAYKKYSADLKLTAVRMYVIRHRSLRRIIRELGQNISTRSLRRWRRLYEETQSVWRDPATYAQRGRTRLLSNEQRDLLRLFIEEDSTAYLDEL